MFQMLQGLIPSGSSLSLTLTGNTDNTISVVVVPKGNGAMAYPLAITGTAAELDEQFAEAIASFSGARKSLAEQIEATTAVLDAAKKESAEQAVKAVTNKSLAPSSASTLKDKTAPKSDPDGEDDGDGEEADFVAVEAAAVPGDFDNLFAD